MMLKITVNKKYMYRASVFFIFSVFFVSPVLSPCINGVSVYLNWFVPFFDLYFCRYLFGIMQKVNGNAALIVLVLLSWMLLHGSILEIFKLLAICYSVIYLQYAYKMIGFKLLYRAFNLNILVAILQFVLYIYSPKIAYQFGPTNVASVIWGEYATPTFTNFFPIFYLPRTCGLSREAGFFAALLSIIFIIYLFDKKKDVKKRQVIFLALGYVVSFSKMSFLAPIALALVLGRRLFDKIPFSIGFLCAWAVFGTISINMNKTGFFTLYNISYAHRLYGYGIVMAFLSVKEVFWGNEGGLLQLNSHAVNEFPIYHSLIATRDNFCGYPEFIIHFGYIGLILLLVALYVFGIRTSGLWTLLIATIDVDFLTATSFVVLAYWFVVCGIKELDIRTWDEYKGQRRNGRKAGVAIP